METSNFELKYVLIVFKGYKLKSKSFNIIFCFSNAGCRKLIIELNSFLLMVQGVTSNPEMIPRIQLHITEPICNFIICCQ